MKETAIKCKKTGEEITSGYVALGGDAYFMLEEDAYEYLLGAFADYTIEDTDGEFKRATDLDYHSFVDWCYDNDYLYWEDWSY